MNEAADDKELVSALADGQLRGPDVERSLDLLARDGQARQAWTHYHLIGDVLRSSDLAASRGHELPSQVMARLRAEPPPRRLPEPPPVPAAVRPAAGHSANEGRYRWRVAAFMSFAGMAGVLAWLLGPVGLPAPQLASAPPVQLAPAAPEAVGAASVVVVSDPRGPMLRSPHLDELLAAHRGLGGATVLQAPTDAVRNAAFETPAR